MVDSESGAGNVLKAKDALKGRVTSKGTGINFKRLSRQRMGLKHIYHMKD